MSISDITSSETLLFTESLKILRSQDQTFEVQQSIEDLSLLLSGSDSFLDSNLFISLKDLKSTHEIVPCPLIISLITSSEYLKLSILASTISREIEGDLEALQFYNFNSFSIEETVLKNYMNIALLQDRLFKIVGLSKKNPKIAIASANAMSLLCAIDYSFAFKDMSCIRIPGANLQSAYLLSATFQNSDLSNVNFKEAVLHHADLSDCQLIGAQFSAPSNRFQFSSAVINTIHFLPQSLVVLLGYTDSSIQVYCIKASYSSNSIDRFSKHLFSISCITASKDEKMILSASEGQLILWRISDFSVKNQRLLDTSIQTCVLSTNLIAAAGNSTIYMISKTDFSILHTVTDSGLKILQMSINATEDVLVSVNTEQAIRCWSIETGFLVHKTTSSAYSAWAAAFTNNGKSIALGSVDKNIYVKDIETELIQLVLKGHKDWIRSLAFSPEDKMLASGGWDKIIFIWSMSTGEKKYMFYEKSSMIVYLKFSIDSNYLLSWEIHGTYTLRRLKQPSSSKEHCCIAYSNCQEFIVHSRNKEIRLYQGLDLVRILYTVEQVQSLALSNCARYAASAERDHRIRIWDIQTGTLFRTINGKQLVPYNLMFSPDSLNIGCWYVLDTLQVWRIQDLANAKPETIDWDSYLDSAQLFNRLKSSIVLSCPDSCLFHRNLNIEGSAITQSTLIQLSILNKHKD